MAGWHHRLNGHESELPVGDSEGHQSLACCNPWARKESDATDRLNNHHNVHLSSKKPCKKCSFSQVALKTSWLPAPSNPLAVPKFLLNGNFRASLAPGKVLGDISSCWTKALYLGSYPLSLSLSFSIDKKEISISVQSLSRVPLFATPWIAALQASPVHFLRLLREPSKRTVYFVGSKTLFFSYIISEVDMPLIFGILYIKPAL